MKIIFEGGLDTYFQGRELNIDKDMIESHSILQIKDLITYLSSKYQSANTVLFEDKTTLSPGNICIINDKDWELLGCSEANISFGDKIYFISMLHGG